MFYFKAKINNFVATFGGNFAWFREAEKLPRMRRYFALAK
jgi:hypothetical protein